MFCIHGLHISLFDPRVSTHCLIGNCTAVIIFHHTGLMTCILSIEKKLRGLLEQEQPDLNPGPPNSKPTALQLSHHNSLIHNLLG